MASTSLQDFVNEQKKSKGTGIQNGLTDLRSKLSSSLASFELPLLGRSQSQQPDAEDLQNGQLPSSHNRKHQNGNGWLSGEDAFGLTRTQRIFGFVMCLLAGMLCFALAVMVLPVVILQSRKFAALNTLGSCFLIFSFALLWGPSAYAKHLFSKPRLAVTLSYLASVLATLYCALWISSTMLTVVCACVQFVCLIWFVVSYVPGGERGLRFMTGMFGSVVKSQSKTVLPI